MMTPTSMDALGLAAADMDDVASAIHTLARLHGITGAPEPIDAFAHAASRLADAEVDLDPVERLLAGLQRRAIVTPQEGFALHAIYLRQKA